MTIGGTYYLVMVDVAGRRFVDRRRQFGVPYRARTQQLVTIIRHLPVKPRQRISEAGIGRWPHHDQVAILIDVAAGDKPQPQRSQSHAGVSGTREPKPRRVSIRAGPNFLRTRPINTSSALES